MNKFFKQSETAYTDYIWEDHEGKLIMKVCHFKFSNTYTIQQGGIMSHNKTAEQISSTEFFIASVDALQQVLELMKKIN